MYNIYIYVNLRCDHPSQVELAQNDVVFCAGGVAESAYLVLSFSAVQGWPWRLSHWLKGKSRKIYRKPWFPPYVYLCISMYIYVYIYIYAIYIYA